MSESSRSGPADRFDPFGDRPSRTVRNALSEKLKECLQRNAIFSAAPRDLLERFPQEPYRGYIRDRTARYRAATRDASSGTASPLAWAAVLWRHRLYFEVHDVLEPHWLAATGDEREGLQGLIQAAGVEVHLEAGHEAAAVSLARKAVERLRRFGDAIGGRESLAIEALIDRLERLVASQAGR